MRPRPKLEDLRAGAMIRGVTMDNADGLTGKETIVRVNGALAAAYMRDGSQADVTMPAQVVEWLLYRALESPGLLHYRDDVDGAN